MFIKVLHSLIAVNNVRHFSLTNGDYSLEYTVGKWIKPVLPGSRLFVYKDLRTALKFHQWVEPTEWPFIGLTFWKCNCIDARNAHFYLKDPPKDLMREYWS